VSNLVFFSFQLEEQYQVEDCRYRSQEDDTVHWHYKGMLLNGEVFDEGNFWAQLGHGSVIRGVDLGMRGLCVGEKRRMIMHPDWGYGSRGTGNIPPNSVLVFDVHLMKVKRPGEGVETLNEKFADNGGVSKDNKLIVGFFYFYFANNRIAKSIF